MMEKMIDKHTCDLETLDAVGSTTPPLSRGFMAHVPLECHVLPADEFMSKSITSMFRNLRVLQNIHEPIFRWNWSMSASSSAVYSMSGADMATGKAPGVNTAALAGGKAGCTGGSSPR